MTQTCLKENFYSAPGTERKTVKLRTECHGSVRNEEFPTDFTETSG